MIERHYGTLIEGAGTDTPSRTTPSRSLHHELERELIRRGIIITSPATAEQYERPPYSPAATATPPTRRPSTRGLLRR